MGQSFCRAGHVGEHLEVVLGALQLRVAALALCWLSERPSGGWAHARTKHSCRAFADSALSPDICS